VVVNGHTMKTTKVNIDAGDIAKLAPQAMHARRGPSAWNRREPVAYPVSDLRIA
jgi:hypothetical protein